MPMLTPNASTLRQTMEQAPHSRQPQSSVARHAAQELHHAPASKHAKLVEVRRAPHRPTPQELVERGFTILGSVTAVLLVTAFGLDLAVGWPFAAARPVYDVSSIACGLGLAYLSWNVRRDQQ